MQWCRCNLWPITPFLARRLSKDFLGRKANLDSLNPAKQLKMVAALVLVSAVLHQLWYASQGHKLNFLSSTALMAVGEFTGSLIVIYLAKFALSKFQDLLRNSV
jgi:hypothetical protein